MLGKKYHEQKRITKDRLSHERDKGLNTPEFNKKAKTRRAKAKHDAKGRKINQRKNKR